MIKKTLSSMISKLKNKKKIFILLIILFAAAAGYYYYNQNQLLQAQKAEHELTLSGNVDIREVSAAFKRGDRISEMYVEEGDSVQQGQVLAKLDTEELTLEIQKIEAQIAAQESSVRRLENGSRPEEIAQAAAKVEAAKAENELAHSDLARKQKAFAESNGKSVSQQDIDAAQSTAQAKAANLDDANQAYALAVQGPRIEDIDEAKAQLQALKEDLNYKEYLMKESELIAPSDGVIRSRLLEVGDMAAAQQAVYTISLNQHKWVRAYVKETDLGKIYEGMQAQVYIDSYPDKAIAGQVGYISSTAEFTPKTVQTDELRTSLLYEIRVYVQDDDNILRMGMPATVKLEF